LWAPSVQTFRDLYLETAVSHIEVLMPDSLRLARFISTLLRSAALPLAVLLIGFQPIAAKCQTESHAALLSSRSDLTAAATAAEAAAITGDPARRAENAILAAAIHQRLRNGDLGVGDRVIVSFVSDAVHADTVVVRADRSLQIAGMIVVPVAGILRSELKDRVSTEVLKYVKAEKIEVTPLLRVAVLGAVARPGYFAFPSDIPLTDAIMGAGGPTPTAAVDRSIVRRQSQEYRSAEETSKAIEGGLTLDQFGIAAGDEIVVGERHNFDASKGIGLLGAMASVAAVIFAIGSH
jgi:protein involved in polysaccharide export with SLBB domain